MNKGYVYLIGNAEHDIWKIGFTLDVADRLRQLDYGMPFPLTVFEALEICTPENVDAADFSRLIELGLHTFFRALDLQLRREWYRGIDRILFRDEAQATIKRVLTGPYMEVCLREKAEAQ